MNRNCAWLSAGSPPSLFCGHHARKNVIRCVFSVGTRVRRLKGLRPPVRSRVHSYVNRVHTRAPRPIYIPHDGMPRSGFVIALKISLACLGCHPVAALIRIRFVRYRGVYRRRDELRTSRIFPRSSRQDARWNAIFEFRKMATVATIRTIEFAPTVISVKSGIEITFRELSDFSIAHDYRLS